jgi:hypothetical protein
LHSDFEAIAHRFSSNFAAIFVDRTATPSRLYSVWVGGDFAAIALRLRYDRVNFN